MKNGKTPRSDGLTVKFYKNFWQDLQDAIKIQNSIKYSFQIDSLSEIKKQGLIYNTSPIKQQRFDQPFKLETNIKPFECRL